MFVDEDLKEERILNLQNINILGRRDITIEKVYLDWTGSGFEVNFEGTELYVTLNCNFKKCEQYVSCLIDRRLVMRMMLLQGFQTVPLFKSIPTGVTRHIYFLKETQPYDDDPDSTIELISLKYKGKFHKLPEKKYKIEFIGDSLTSADGCLGVQKNSDYINMYFSAAENYCTLTALNLNSDFRIIAMSGYGVYSFWNNDTRKNMYDNYELICGYIMDSEIERGCKKVNDFKYWNPDIICINLASNDYYSFYWKEPFVHPETGEVYSLKLDNDGKWSIEGRNFIKGRMLAMLHKVRMYNPDSIIIWVHGMLIIHGQTFSDDVIDTIKAFNDPRAFEIQLPVVQDLSATDGGSDGHAGPHQQRLYADILAEKIRELLTKI